MPPSKIDHLNDTLGGLLTAIGEFRSDIKTLYTRGSEDRRERQKEHRENQDRMGEIAQSTARAIAELGQTATDRWEETSREIISLRAAVTAQGEKLDEHAAAVSSQQSAIARLQLGRGKLAALASVGLFAMWVIWWALDAGLHWALDRILKMKFGG